MVDEMTMMESEEKLDFDTFSKMNETFFKWAFAQWFFYGNIWKEEAMKIVSETEKVLQKEKMNLEEIVLEDILKVPEGGPLHFSVPTEDEDNTNSALVEFY